MTDFEFPIVVGGEEVLSERELLTQVEAGLMMSGPEAIRFIVIHCSATRADRDYTVQQLMRDHKARGFRTIGYHFYIRKSGEVSQHRKLLEVGAHARYFNRCSIGICYEGGITAVVDSGIDNGELTIDNLPCGSKSAVRLVPADTRTPEQKAALYELICKLHKLFPKAEIVGHRDLPGVHKACPCFDVQSVYGCII